MLYKRLPTCIILERPTVKHLFGKWFWDFKYNTLLKGDKKFSKKG